MLHGKFKSQYTLSLSSSFLLLLCPSLEKGETPRYHGSKISESQQSFLIQPDGHFHFRTTDKKPMGCRSVLDHECNHSPKIHTYHFFFLPCLKDQGLLRSKSFATMATRRNNGSSRFLIAHCIFCLFCFVGFFSFDVRFSLKLRWVNRFWRFCCKHVVTLGFAFIN